jgi:hypothetical protein
MLGFGANNKNLLPIEPQIAQDLSMYSNVVTMKGDAETYPRLRSRTSVHNEDDVADLKVMKISMLQRHDDTTPVR